MNLNSVVIAGRLTHEPEVKYGQTGTPVCSFRIALNDYNDKAHFFGAVCFKGTAEALAQYKKKGDEVVVIGELSLDQWETKDGSKRSEVKIIARSVQWPFTGESKPQQEEQAAPDNVLDDIPF